MAIKAFTRKPVGTGSSDKFLEKYEELLKRNKGGRLLTGYEASSQNPIYIPGKVINPTGLGETAQQSAQRSANRLPQYGEMLPEEFADVLSGMDFTKLTPEEREQLSQTIDFYTEDVRRQSANLDSIIDKGIDNPEYTALQPVMGPPTPTGMLKRNRPPEERKPRETIGEMMGPPSPKTEVMGPPAPKLSYDDYNKQLLSKQYGIDATNMSPDELQKLTLNALNKDFETQESEYLNTPKKTLEQELAESRAEMENLKVNNPDEYNKRLAGSWNRGADRFQMEKTGQTPEQLQEESNMELSVPEGFEKSEDGSIRKKQTGMRGEMGDALDVLATYLKLPETGLSEKIAGRPTRNTVVANAAEPTEVQQAGSGLERLRDDMSYSPSAMSGRPDFSSIGLKRSIGNVAGMAGQSAVSPASSPMNPSGQTMNSVARVNEGGSPVVSNISANPMMQSIGVGTNQPAQVTQNNQNNQQNNQPQQNNQQSQPRQNQPQQMGPPAPKQTTSYKAPTPISKVFAPTNIGVGSNQPAKVQPVSQPAPKQNVVQTVTKAVSSFLSNLFRRK